jgi:hypothetical protein
MIAGHSEAMGPCGFPADLSNFTYVDQVIKRNREHDCVELVVSIGSLPNHA